MPDQISAAAKENWPQTHEWDKEGCCIHCGFDGAEWEYWKTTPAGLEQPELKIPRCGRFGDE